MTKVRDAEIIAAEISAIKEQTKRFVLSASIEIGQRLTEAKELVQHGEWTHWLREKCEFSQRTADNLMRIYREYGNAEIGDGGSNSQTLANLTYSQAVALFAVPADERADFVEENNVDTMSSRQLKEAIQAREEAEKRAAQLQNKLEGTNQLLEIANEGRDKLQQALKQADDSKALAESRAAQEIQQLKAELDSVKVPLAPAPAEVEQMKKAVRQEVEAEYRKKSEQLSFEKKTAEEKAAEIEKKYREKIKALKLDNESILERQKAAEKQLSTMAPEAHQCTAYLNSIQQNFQNILTILESLKNKNPEMAQKLNTGMKTILTQLLSQIK